MGCVETATGLLGPDVVDDAAAAAAAAMIDN